METASTAHTFRVYQNVVHTCSWCRAKPGELSKPFTIAANKLQSSLSWRNRTIKAVIVSCMEAEEQVTINICQSRFTQSKRHMSMCVQGGSACASAIAARIYLPHEMRHDWKLSRCGTLLAYQKVQCTLQGAAAGPISTADVFAKLDKHAGIINDNTKSIVAVLAAPVVLEYAYDWQKTATTFVMVLGVAAVCVAVPVVGFAVAVSEASAGAALLVGGAVSVYKTAQLTYGELPRL